MHPLVALVTLLALVLFMWMTVRVASARTRCGVPAPATSGHPEFERHFRVQANTLEGLIVSLPALWLFALFVGNDYVAAGLGLVWVVGRVIYMLGYAKAAESRGPGYGIQALAQAVLLFGALGFVVWRLLRPGF
ncbi:MAG: MAPEG family protein [Caulobacteraceae bacterium]|nr:MAPEG family protein [Caulobacteraceae bacterium]